MRRLVALFAIVGLGACGPEAGNRAAQAPVFTGPAPLPGEVLTLPKRPGSIRFAAIGDAGRGHPPQYEVAATMAAFRKVFDFGFIVMLGDNVYDGGTQEDYRQKF